MTFSFSLLGEMQIVRTRRIAESHRETHRSRSPLGVQLALLYVACRMRQIEQRALEEFVAGVENVIRRKPSRYGVAHDLVL